MKKCTFRAGDVAFFVGFGPPIDGDKNTDDINAFIAVLLGTSPNVGLNCRADLNNDDLNNDDRVNGLDLQSFVEATLAS